MRKFETNRISKDAYANEEIRNIKADEGRTQKHQDILKDVGPYVIGAALRGEFRRACFNLQITYKEDKRLLDSSFFLSGPKTHIRYLDGKLAELNRTIRSDECKEEERPVSISSSPKSKHRHFLYLSLALNILLVVSHFIF